MLIEPPVDNAAADAHGNGGLSVTEVLRAALAPLTARIDTAFIYGPAAKGAATAQGDIDLMIIGRGIGYADVIPHLISAAKYIGRGIQPSIYSADELTRKLASGNRVVLAVLKQRKIFVFGSANEILQQR